MWNAPRFEVPLVVGLRLFLPESWTSDAARMSRAGVPEACQTYRTKPEIALSEIDRLPAVGVTFGTVLADAGYGLSDEEWARKFTMNRPGRAYLVSRSLNHAHR